MFPADQRKREVVLGWFHIMSFLSESREESVDCSCELRACRSCRITTSSGPSCFSRADFVQDKRLQKAVGLTAQFPSGAVATDCKMVPDVKHTMSFGPVPGKPASSNSTLCTTSAKTGRMRWLSAVSRMFHILTVSLHPWLFWHKIRF